ncbi:MAG: hypothetical protein R3E83_14690 [Burkholderiaceae bacterium]
MPMPIPSAAMAIFAVMMQPSQVIVQETDSLNWRIVERVQTGEQVRLNGMREVATLETCLRSALSEGQRLSLGEPMTIASAQITRVRFGQADVSFSCLQVSEAGAVMAVNGSEETLRSLGYRFGWE